MSKGIIYIMTSTIDGLIKIGQTGRETYEERMRKLEIDGYRACKLNRYFAIEVEDYADKERLLKEIFTEKSVGGSELFNLDCDMVKSLLLSFEGKVVYPNDIDKEKSFDETSRTIDQNNRFSFYRKGLKKGTKINFAKDKSKVATVASEYTVMYDGSEYKLSPLARLLMFEIGEENNSRTYRGAAYFEYKDILLTKLPDKY